MAIDDRTRIVVPLILRIALIGDAMNTAARIVDACRDRGEPVLVSAALLHRLAIPAGIAARALGPIPLRGKQMPVELFALEAAGPMP
jgi:adenylate cyclase